ILAVRKENDLFKLRAKQEIDYDSVVRNIVETFTNIMEDSVSRDFACVIFSFVSRDVNGDILFHFYNRGMYYPFLLESSDDGSVICRNLNDQSENWVPAKNSPLGSDFRILLGDRYIQDKPAILRVTNGARLCFFSDGIIEAPNESEPAEEFGLARFESSLRETFHHFPQSSINTLYDEVYDFIGNPMRQSDDMTAVVIDIPKNVI
ncbi:MAG TPA: SpoIIE family protein phosphatase, partial [Spirochaetota bacterium]